MPWPTPSVSSVSVRPLSPANHGNMMQHEGASWFNRSSLNKIDKYVFRDLSSMSGNGPFSPFEVDRTTTSSPTVSNWLVPVASPSVHDPDNTSDE